MASLREIKDRINSVKSTLKITSALKLVSSSKLRKAQKAIEGLRPYEQAMESILSSLSPYINASQQRSVLPQNQAPSPDKKATISSEAEAKATAVIAISSNTSLCGAFNTNVIRHSLEFASSCGKVLFFPIGRKIREAIKKTDYTFEPCSDNLISKPSYQSASELAAELKERFDKGEFSRIVLIYNSFVSAGKQHPVVEQFLPYKFSESPDEACCDKESIIYDEEDFIFEPSAEEILSQLLPQLTCLKLYAALLDSCASEHAARTIAMQTASDNAQNLLSELSLEYNKGRQQKITAEILDLIGGTI